MTTTSLITCHWSPHMLYNQRETRACERRWHRLIPRFGSPNAGSATQFFHIDGLFWLSLFAKSVIVTQLCTVRYEPPSFFPSSAKCVSYTGLYNSNEKNFRFFEFCGILSSEKDVDAINTIGRLVGTPTATDSWTSGH